MTTRIGVSPAIWSDDTPLEVCLAQASQAGFEGIELGLWFPHQPDALLAALSPFGLACISGEHCTSLIEHDAEVELRHMRPLVDLLRAVGSEIMVIAETSNAIHDNPDAELSGRPMLPPQDWARFGARLTEVGDSLLGEGVRLVYHHRIGTVVQSATDIAALMAHTGPSVQLLLDTGHAAWAGADPAELAEHYRNRIGHVHAQDFLPEQRRQAAAHDLSVADAIAAGIFAIPGEGALDFVRILRNLHGYTGWLVAKVQQDPLRADPLQGAMLGHRNLIGLLAQAAQARG